MDLLEKEKVLRTQREKALEFLDNLTKGGDSKKEKEQIEKRIISILQGQLDTIEQLDTHISQLKQRESQLDEEIKTKSLECERAEKRLEGLQGARPKADSEQIQLENELNHLFRIYVEKLRNHDYMEQKLDEFNKIQIIKDDIEHRQLQDIKKEMANQKQNVIFDKGIMMKNEDDDNDDNGDVNDIEYNYEEVAKMKNNYRDQNNTRTNPRSRPQPNDDRNEDDEGLVDGEEDEEDENW